LQKEVEFYGDTRAAIKKHSGEELDIKPYEADMRHLLNTYVQADPAADLGDLNSLSLTEAIIETGIHDAIAHKLNEKGKLSRNAIAEGIINNVRKTIIRDQLTDPRFYAEMSKLLDDLIKQSRADAVAASGKRGPGHRQPRTGHAASRVQLWEAMHTAQSVRRSSHPDVQGEQRAAGLHRANRIQAHGCRGRERWAVDAYLY
jgi:hypothetical protein